MAWQDRQREAALTTPDGTRFEFLYEDLERNRSENSSVFRFAEKSGAFIQRLSSGQDIYPLTVIFSGEDYDLVAADFWEKTKTPGVFLLEHPRFTGLKRVQLMTIRERVAAKTGDNQASFDIVLHETIEVVAPQAALDATTEILDKANELSGNAALAFEDNTELENAIVVTDLQTESQSFVDDIESVFRDTAAKEDAINTAFSAQFLSVSSAVNGIAERPLDFSSNAAVFVATPSRVSVSVLNRVGDYRALFDTTINSLRFSESELLEASKNKGALAVLASMGIVSAMCQAAVSSAKYGTRAEVIEIADIIIDTVDETIEVLDEYAEGFALQDDPSDRRFEITDARNSLDDLASLATAQLFNVAFTLRQERFITLSSASDPYNLAHRLYGFSDENVDFLIETNQLKGNELFEIPKDKEIVYYV